jgi:hypothetical protein
MEEELPDGGFRPRKDVLKIFNSLGELGLKIMVEGR